MDDLRYSSDFRLSDTVCSGALDVRHISDHGACAQHLFVLAARKERSVTVVSKIIEEEKGGRKRKHERLYKK